MYLVDSVKLDDKPRNLIAGQIPELSKQIKMTEHDSAFVCGLLERFKPKKIVEVGIANGGTSAVIMQCMSLQGREYELHSVDKLEKGYAGDSREIGFLGVKAAELLCAKDYHLWKGVVLPEVIEKIGAGIDFLILDTMHKLPGETLDFLAAYPYLTDHAVVCLHDIRQNHKTPPEEERIATNVLFNSIAADKYINSDPERDPD